MKNQDVETQTDIDNVKLNLEDLLNFKLIY